MLTIDFLRHGALEGGIKYRGTQDDPLTQEGRIAMGLVWSSIQEDVSCIFSSPLSRCADPAQAWAKKASIPCHLDARIQELDYGVWEGKTVAEIERYHLDLLTSWRKDPTGMTPPNGEAMADFANRTQDFLQELIRTNKQKHILVVGHSGSIRLFLAHAMQAPIQSTRCLAMPYACWSRVKVDSHGFTQLAFHAKDINSTTMD